MPRVSVEVVHDMIRAGNDTIEELVELSGWPRANIEGAIRQLNMIVSGDDKPIKRGQPAPRPRPIIVPQHVVERDSQDDELDRELDRIHDEDSDAIEAELAALTPARGDVRPIGTRPGPTTVVTQVPARPGPLVNTPTPLELLIEKAAKSPSKRTQALGSKIDDLCTELTSWLKEEAARELAEREERQRREKAKAEVERLEQQLARARAAAGLKPAAKKAKTPRPTPEGMERLPDPVPGESTSKIRSWAIEKGIEVGTVGRLPHLVVMEYRRAHQATAS